MQQHTCPRCGTVVAAETTDGLVCPTCGYPGEDARASAGSSAGSFAGSSAGSSGEDPAAGAAEPTADPATPAAAPGPGAPAGWGAAWSPQGGWTPQPGWTGAPYAGGPVCPRCLSTNTRKGAIPVWAIVLAVVGFFVVCALSLLFLLVREDNQCFNCGLTWK